MAAHDLTGTVLGDSSATGGLSADAYTLTGTVLGVFAAGALSLGISHNLQGTVSGVFGASSFNTCGTGITVRHAIQRILNLWSWNGCQTGNMAESEAIGTLNAAMQRLYASGKEWGYISTVPLTISVVGGEVELPQDVVSVKRCVFRPALNITATSFATFPLRPLKTRHEYDSFRDSHDVTGLWDLTTAEAALDAYKIPLAYFTEAEDTRTGAADRPPALRLLFAPVFDGVRPAEVQIQASVEPPRYCCSDIAAGTMLAVPHRYAESLLIPLARYYALSSRYFTKPDLKEAVMSQASDVLKLIGDLQPAAPEASKPEPAASRR